MAKKKNNRIMSNNNQPTKPNEKIGTKNDPTERTTRTSLKRVAYPGHFDI